METENKFGVPYSRRGNGEAKKISKAITRKGIFAFDKLNILKKVKN